MLTVVVPRPDESDAAALAELKASTFRDTYGAVNSPEQLEKHIATAFAVDAVAGELTDPRCTHVWVLDDDWPVAYLKLNLRDAQTEGELSAGMEIEQIYTRRSHQGRGIGRTLLQRAEHLGRDHAVPFLWLGVWENNTNAIAFYEHYGFETVGEHEFMFGDEPQRDLLMRLQLPR